MVVPIIENENVAFKYYFQTDPLIQNTDIAGEKIYIPL